MLMQSIPKNIATLCGFDVEETNKESALVGLRQALQSAGPLFDQARATAVNADAIPILLQLLYSSTAAWSHCMHR